MQHAKAGLHPAKASWSVTMYDGKSRLLADNPIDHYLTNSQMLPQLKTTGMEASRSMSSRSVPARTRRASGCPRRTVLSTRSCGSTKPRRMRSSQNGTTRKDPFLPSATANANRPTGRFFVRITTLALPPTPQLNNGGDESDAAGNMAAADDFRQPPQIARNRHGGLQRARHYGWQPLVDPFGLGIPAQDSSMEMGAAGYLTLIGGLANPRDTALHARFRRHIARCFGHSKSSLNSPH
jgi:hypothetical protein